MSDDRYFAYARETALCVDFAYEAFQGDLERELSAASADTREVILRLIETVRTRRSVLEKFTLPGKSGASAAGA